MKIVIRPEQNYSADIQKALDNDPDLAGLKTIMELTQEYLQQNPALGFPDIRHIIADPQVKVMKQYNDFLGAERTLTSTLFYPSDDLSLPRIIC